MSVRSTRNNDRWRKRHSAKHEYRCHWCKVKVVPPPNGKNQSEYKVPQNMATTDHLYHKWDLRRNLEHSKTRVLACFKCNQERRLEITDPEWFNVEIISIRDLLTAAIQSAKK